ncbi:MAG: hypothetical protein WCG25_06215 [bacterium]
MDLAFFVSSLITIFSMSFHIVHKLGLFKIICRVLLDVLLSSHIICQISKPSSLIISKLMFEVLLISSSNPLFPSML